MGFVYWARRLFTEGVSPHNMSNESGDPGRKGDARRRRGWGGWNRSNPPVQIGTDQRRVHFAMYSSSPWPGQGESSLRRRGRWGPAALRGIREIWYLIKEEEEEEEEGIGGHGSGAGDGGRLGRGGVAAPSQQVLPEAGAVRDALGESQRRRRSWSPAAPRGLRAVRGADRGDQGRLEDRTAARGVRPPPASSVLLRRGPSGLRPLGQARGAAGGDGVERRTRPRLRRPGRHHLPLRRPRRAGGCAVFHGEGVLRGERGGVRLLGGRGCVQDRGEQAILRPRSVGAALVSSSGRGAFGGAPLYGRDRAAVHNVGERWGAAGGGGGGRGAHGGWGGGAAVWHWRGEGGEDDCLRKWEDAGSVHRWREVACHHHRLLQDHVRIQLRGLYPGFPNYLPFTLHWSTSVLLAHIARIEHERPRRKVFLTLCWSSIHLHVFWGDGFWVLSYCCSNHVSASNIRLCGLVKCGIDEKISTEGLTS